MLYLLNKLFPTAVDDPYYLWLMWAKLYTGQVVRYFFFAGIGFLVFYYLWRSYWQPRKIQTRSPKRERMLEDIGFSLSSLLVFSVVIMGIHLATQRGLTRLYMDPAEYGWAWLVVSVPVMLFWHDTWFYWTHRFMHWKPIYKTVHAIHHRSTNPTPWTAFAFHPLEAILEIGFIGIVFILPLHPITLVIIGIHQMTFNVLGHSGFEIFGRRFHTTGWFRFFNTPTHHNQHHQKFNCNYGLYYNVWDRWMGTNHATYTDHFVQVVERAEAERTERTERAERRPEDVALTPIHAGNSADNRPL